MRPIDRSANGPERRRSRGRRLTDRQAAILELVSDGLGNKEIASLLGVSEQAIKEHVSTLMRLLEAPNRAALGDAAATRRFLGSSDVDPQWLRYLFQESPVHVAIVAGPEHRFVAVNTAYQAACGDREIVGRPYREVFPERATLAEELDRAYATGERFVGTEIPRRFVRERGGPEQAGHVTVVLQPLPDVAGGTGGVAIFNVDVTETVLARRRAREIETEELAILDQIPSGVIVIDRDGRVRMLNAAGRRLLPGASVDGRPWDVLELRDFATGRTLTNAERPLLRALEGAHVPETDFLGTIVATGEEVAIRATTAPLFDEGGEVRGAIAVFTALPRPPA